MCPYYILCTWAGFGIGVRVGLIIDYNIIIVGIQGKRRGEKKCFRRHGDSDGRRRLERVTD